jgi:hypothetical protein
MFDLQLFGAADLHRIPDTARANFHRARSQSLQSLPRNPTIHFKTFPSDARDAMTHEPTPFAPMPLVRGRQQYGMCSFRLSERKLHESPTVLNADIVRRLHHRFGVPLRG